MASRSPRALWRRHCARPLCWCASHGEAGGVQGVRPLQVTPQLARDPLLSLRRPIHELRTKLRSRAGVDAERRGGLGHQSKQAVADVVQPARARRPRCSSTRPSTRRSVPEYTRSSAGTWCCTRVRRWPRDESTRSPTMASPTDWAVAVMCGRSGEPNIRPAAAIIRRWLRNGCVPKQVHALKAADPVAAGEDSRKSDVCWLISVSDGRLRRFHQGWTRVVCREGDADGSPHGALRRLERGILTGATSRERFVLIAAVATLLFTAAGEPAVGQGGEAGNAARALSGAIDIHVHHLPDDRPRSIDAIDVAKLASARGMRGIVLKNHYESTAGIAYLYETRYLASKCLVESTST